MVALQPKRLPQAPCDSVVVRNIIALQHSTLIQIQNSKEQIALKFH